MSVLGESAESIKAPNGNRSPTGGGARDVVDPEKLCANLLTQLEDLRAQVRKLREERDAYRRAICGLLDKYEPVPEFTREELFACIGQQPSIEELIAELEREMEAEHAGRPRAPVQG